METVSTTQAKVLLAQAAASVGKMDFPKPIKVRLVDEGLLGDGGMGYSEDFSCIEVIVDDGGISRQEHGRVPVKSLCHAILAVKHEGIHVGQQRVFMGLAEHDASEKMFLDFIAYDGNMDYALDEDVYANNVCECFAVVEGVSETALFFDGKNLPFDAESVLLEICNETYVKQGFVGEDLKGHVFESLESFADAVEAHCAKALESKPKHVYADGLSDDEIYKFTTPRASGILKAFGEFVDAWVDENTDGWDKAKMMGAYTLARRPVYCREFPDYASMSLDVKGMDMLRLVRNSMKASLEIAGVSQAAEVVPEDEFEIG